MEKGRKNPWVKFRCFFVRVNSTPVFMIVWSLIPGDGVAVGGHPALYFILLSFPAYVLLPYSADREKFFRTCRYCLLSV